MLLSTLVGGKSLILLQLTFLRPTLLHLRVESKPYKTELNVVKEQEIRFDPDLCRVVYVESTTTPDPMGVEEKRNSKMDFYVVKEDGQWRILDNGISDRILARNICEMYIEGRYP